MKLFTGFLIGSLLFAATAASASSRSGIISVEVDLTAQKTGESARLWLPYPLSDRDQSIGDIRVSGDFASSGVYTDKLHGTPILYAEWPKEAASRKLTLSFSVERQEIRLPLLPEKEPKWNQVDYAEYLQPTSRGPIDGEVKKLADEIVKGKKTVLAKARAIYDWTVENMYRDPTTRGCGQGDVCLLLTKPGGKCTDISSVYVALCRAAGVPAREIFGLRLGKQTAEEISTWQHCWAEFFLPGSGWIPVDPADVRKAMLVEKLELHDPKVKEVRAYYWGGLDPYRFKLASGRDLVLNPRQTGAPLNTFGYPYAEIGGIPLDFYDPKAFVYRIGYREH